MDWKFLEDLHRQLVDFRKAESPTITLTIDDAQSLLDCAQRYLVSQAKSQAWLNGTPGLSFNHDGELVNFTIEDIRRKRG